MDCATCSGSNEAPVHIPVAGIPPDQPPATPTTHAHLAAQLVASHPAPYSQTVCQLVFSQNKGRSKWIICTAGIQVRAGKCPQGGREGDAAVRARWDQAVPVCQCASVGKCRGEGGQC